MSRVRIALGASSAILIATGVAAAATPEAGKIDKASPRVEWKGEVTGSFLHINLVANAPEDYPCVPPGCDTFALTVGDGPQDLNLGADLEDGDGDGGDVYMRVTGPDGVVTFFEGTADDGKPAKFKLKKAGNGEHVIDYFNNFIDGPIPYTGFAELASAAAAPAPSPPTVPTPGPAPAPKESYTVTVKAGKLSAKKLNKAKKTSVTVSASRPLKSIAAQLKKGKSAVAKGSAGATQSTAKVALKVAKKLKAGKYSLVVTTVSDQDVKSVKTVSMSVRK